MSSTLLWIVDFHFLVAENPQRGVQPWIAVLPLGVFTPGFSAVVIGHRSRSRSLSLSLSILTSQLPRFYAPLAHLSASFDVVSSRDGEAPKYVTKKNLDLS